MEFIDLKSQQKLIKEKINERISVILDHGKYIMGPEVHELERDLVNIQRLNIVLLVPRALMHYLFHY